MRKTTIQSFYSSSVHKKARKSTSYSKNNKFSKSGKVGHEAKATGFAKWSVWHQNQNCQKHARKDSTTILEPFCAKKTARRNTYYSRNNTFSKIGHEAKAIAFA